MADDLMTSNRERSKYIWRDYVLKPGVAIAFLGTTALYLEKNGIAIPRHPRELILYLGTIVPILMSSYLAGSLSWGGRSVPRMKDPHAKPERDAENDSPKES